jgi:sarcosine oxidase, subunit gamma
VAETPQRHSPLAKARYEPSGGLRLAERRGLTLIHLAGRPERVEFLEAIRGALGVDLPLAPNTSARSGDLTVLWLGPGRWLIESSGADAGTRLRGAAPPGAAVTDVSSGRAVIRIAGDVARRTLAAECPLDLHPRSFPPGAAVQTMFAA